VAAFDAGRRRSHRHALHLATTIRSSGVAAVAHALPTLAPAYRSRIAARARRVTASVPPLPTFEFCPRQHSAGSVPNAIDIVAARSGVNRSIIEFAVASARAWHRPTPFTPAPPTSPFTHPLPLSKALIISSMPSSPAREALLRSSTHGFHLGYRGGRHATWRDNHPSAYHPDLHHHLYTEVQRNISKTWMLDVTEIYLNEPLLPALVSPLAIVPKATPGKWRNIFDGSAGLGTSVNDGIEPALWHDHPRCSTVADVCSAITRARALTAPGEDVLLLTADVSDAYRMLPISPACWWQVAQVFEGRVYYHLTDPFGLRPAAHHLYSAALPIIDAIEASTGFRPCLFVDDSLAAVPSSCAPAMHTAIRTLFPAGGLPLSPKVDTAPAHERKFIGFLWNTRTNLFSLPPDKLCKIQRLLAALCTATRMPTKSLRSLLGLLTHASQATRHLGAFMSDLNNDLANADGRRWARLSQAGRRDLAMWHDFLSTFSGSSLITLPPPSMHIYSDACTSHGWGWYCPELNIYGAGVWPPELAHLHINELEFIACLIALFCSAPFSPPGSHRMVHADNTAAVKTLREARGKHGNLARLARSLCFMLESLTSTLSLPPTQSAEHIPGVENVIADSLSRGTLPQSLLTCGATMLPCPLPWLLSMALREQPWRATPPSPTTARGVTTGTTSSPATASPLVTSLAALKTPATSSFSSSPTSLPVALAPLPSTLASGPCATSGSTPRHFSATLPLVTSASALSLSPLRTSAPSSPPTSKRSRPRLCATSLAWEPTPSFPSSWSLPLLSSSA
jgi:hypothetical protein